MTNLETSQQNYQTELVIFIQPYLEKTFTSIESATHTNDITVVVQALRLRFLLATIVVDLYEKEYPFIAEKIYSAVPQLKQLPQLTSVLVKKMTDLLPSGVSKIGPNLVYKKDDSFSLLLNDGSLYAIDPALIVSYPVIYNELLSNTYDEPINPQLIIKLDIEDVLGTLSQDFSNELNNHNNSIDCFTAMYGNLIAITKESDYTNLSDAVIQSAHKPQLAGYKGALEMCSSYADSIKTLLPQETKDYNNEFIQQFSAEYAKRLQFLSLLGKFINDIPQTQEYIWFLRDQIEAYMLLGVRDTVTGKFDKNQHSLVTISRNSTSYAPKDHYLYVILNEIFYKSANTCDQTYDDFIKSFCTFLKQAENTDPIVKQINDNVYNYCVLKNLDILNGVENAVTIDTGFQGTFNIYLEALIANRSTQPKHITHQLTGIWPWLTSILKSKYTTTYFPAILTIELFDGIHEVSQLESFINGVPQFKTADLKHQLPAFLDMIMIRDVGILLATQFSDHELWGFKD